MPYAGRDFPKVGNAESVELLFDFAERLVTSESISSAAWSIAVVWGTDADANTRLIDDPINESKKTKHQIAGLVNGVRYQITAVVVTTEGQTLELYSFIETADPTSIIVIEDGTNVLAANSYNSVLAIRMFARDRGRTLVLDDQRIEQFAIRAMDWLEAQRKRYQGQITYPDQPLAFPRQNMVVEGVYFPFDIVPSGVRNAQSQLVLDISAGVELFPTRTDNRRVIRKKIGPIDTTYEYLSDSPGLLSAETFLLPYIQPSGLGLRVERI